VVTEDMSGLRVRIGELSRRVGVSDHVLRAWERRYGLLDPQRSSGGFRLYTEDDERRVRRMVTLLDQGLSASEAARVALAAVPTNGHRPGPPGTPPEVPPSRASRAELAVRRRQLAEHLEAFEEPAAQQVLDALLTADTVETALREVVLPYLHDLGDRWSAGEVSVAQEHFASQVVRGRLAALTRGWGEDRGPRALLACPPGEHHDLALLAFGVVLARRGWGVDFLGADTPVDSLEDVAAGRQATVVMSATASRRFLDVERPLTRLASHSPLYLAGPGASPDIVERVGARRLDGDPVTAAEQLSRGPDRGR
jgi:MerR family transcriptional regulator, light-induced transcriptional regulator